MVDVSKIIIDDVIGNSEYVAEAFCSEISSNQLIKICTGDSLYILKVYSKNVFYEKERDFMYLFRKNKCKVPRLVRYSSSGSQLWILYEYIEGISLSQFKHQLTLDDMKHIWKQVGRELRKIHSISILNEAETEKNKSVFLHKIERTVEIFNNYLDKREPVLLLVNAIHFLKNNISRIIKSNYGIVLYDINDKHFIIKQTKGKWRLNAFVDFEQTRFGCLFIDIACLYINALFENKELDKSFRAGYDPEQLNFDDNCICFFSIYFGIELCTVLRKDDVCNYQRGIFIIENTLKLINL